MLFFAEAVTTMLVVHLTANVVSLQHVCHHHFIVKWMQNISTYNTSLSMCFKLCDSLLSDDGLECWAFTFCSSRNQCDIYFCADPYMVTNTTHMRLDPRSTLHTTQCYRGHIGEGNNQTSEASVVTEADFNCTKLTTIEPRMMSSSATIPGNTFDHFAKGKSTEQTLGSLTPKVFGLTTGTPSSTFGSTPPSARTQQRLADPLQTSSVEQVHSSQSVTTISIVTRLLDTSPVTLKTTSDAAQSLDYGRFCWCSCHNAVMDKKQLIQEILTNLTINMKQLSSYRVKYTSVKDVRPLAARIGYAGAGCAFLVVGLVILSDFIKFVLRKNMAQ